MTTALIQIDAIALPDAIEGAYCSSAAALSFFEMNHTKLSAPQIKRVNHAYARAAFREGRDLLAPMVALIQNCTLEQVAHQAKVLFGLSVDHATRLTNLQAGRIMMRLMENETV